MLAILFETKHNQSHVRVTLWRNWLSISLNAVVLTLDLQAGQLNYNYQISPVAKNLDIPLRRPKWQCRTLYHTYATRPNKFGSNYPVHARSSVRTSLPCVPNC